MTMQTFMERLRAVRRSDRGDVPPEQLIMFAIVSGAAAAVAWFILGSRFGALRWMAVPLAAFAVLSIGIYLAIKGSDALAAARWRRAHETGE